MNQREQLEEEYRKIPITIDRKSLHLKRRKEDLEFQLDQVDKSIRDLKGQLKIWVSFNLITFQ